MTDFETYSRRNKRNKKLEELYSKTRALVAAMKTGEETLILRCFADVKDVLNDIDLLPRPDQSMTSN